MCSERTLTPKMRQMEVQLDHQISSRRGMQRERIIADPEKGTEAQEMTIGYSWASLDPEVGGNSGGRCSQRGELGKMLAESHLVCEGVSFSLSYQEVQN